MQSAAADRSLHGQQRRHLRGLVQVRGNWHADCTRSFRKPGRGDVMVGTTTDTLTDEQIVIAHGGGGEMTRRLIAEHLLPKLGNALLAPLTDSAILPVTTGRIAF